MNFTVLVDPDQVEFEPGRWSSDWKDGKTAVEKGEVKIMDAPSASANEKAKAVDWTMRWALQPIRAQATCRLELQCLPCSAEQARVVMEGGDQSLAVFKAGRRSMKWVPGPERMKTPGPWVAFALADEGELETVPESMRIKSYVKEAIEAIGED